MKLINGLFIETSSIQFNKFIDAFNSAFSLYPNYSLFLEYLKYRFLDAYDMQQFINNLTIKDEKENTFVYQRKENEYKAYINRLYGPFYTGKDNDDLSIFTNKNELEIIEYIVNNTNIDNEVMKKYMDESNTTNIYDFYRSLYLQRIEKDIEDENLPCPVEEDDEYVLWNYTNLRHEQNGSKPIVVLDTPKESWIDLIEMYKKGEIDDENEPNDLQTIIKLSNFENKKYPVFDYKNKLIAAMLARFAGCMLGAPVENWSIEKMQDHAKNTNTPFPPTTYWNKVNDEEGLHYKRDKKYLFSKEIMNCVVADDDVTYTVLNALIMKKYGKDFSIKQLSDFWKDHLPYACTAEYCTMVGLRRNKYIDEIVNTNPFVELIGAAIRADAFGYVYPGDPYNAALLAYKDAVISHKRNGIYGEMFLAASIAASFSTSNGLDAIKIGMNYIPNNCRLKKDLLWALSYENKKLDYKQANELITKRFNHMNRVHTNNNMCAIIFSLIIGENDFTKTISNCIAMGYDNDCTGASVGSIMGATLSLSGIDEKWYKPFNDQIHTYIRGYESITISELIEMLLKI